MTFYILISLGAFSLIWVIIFFAREYRDLGTGTPSMDPQEFNEITSEAQPSEPFVDIGEYENKVYLLEKELTSLKEGTISQVQDARERLDELKEQNQKLEEALKTERQQNRQQEESRIKKLEEENAKLRVEKEELLKSQKASQEKEGEDSQKSKELEGQLRTTNEEHGKQQKELKALIERLREQNEQFVTRMQNSEDKATQLQSQLETMKKGTQEQIKEAAESTRQQLVDSIQQIDEAKHAEESNAELLEREKALQTELTKSRAQALGLERICEDLKVKIESLSQFSDEPQKEEENTDEGQE